MNRQGSMDHNDDPKKKSEKNKKDTESWLNKHIDRKDFRKQSQKLGGLIISGGILGSLMPLACSSKATNTPALHTPLKTQKNPFQLGIASGDPQSDGVVLWTRLAPEPLKIGGGMTSGPVDVHWEVAEDDAFNRIVQSGTAVADPKWAHSVHIALAGLAPNQKNSSRVKSGEEVNPSERTQTTPAAHESTRELTFAFASCQSYNHGYYTAYDHMVEENIDVVFFLGDYIYQDGRPGHI